MYVQLVRGAAAEGLLTDAVFREEWTTLCASCPWSTPYQSPRLAGIWYRTYRPTFEPVLVFCRDETGHLSGLLPLALGKQELVVAGGYQAEYQAWICRPELAETFPLQAIRQVRAEIRYPLRFHYLPPTTPISWACDSRASRFWLLQKRLRPIVQFGDGSAVQASLNKSGNKSRLRRLRKIGPIEFRHLQDPAEFPALLQEIIPCHDTRYLARHGQAPFQVDPLKKAFHQAMMNAPGLLHVTTLRIGGLLASAQLNLIQNKEVQLGLISHNPLLSKFSPGKLHTLFLSRLLFQEGFEQLDLTPGDECYKDRHATDDDEVHILTVFPTVTQRRFCAARATLEEAIKQLVKVSRLDVSRIKAAARRARHRGLGREILAACARGRSWIYSRRRYDIYSAAIRPDIGADPSCPVRRDALEDLLAYQPPKSFRHALSAEEFLADAMDRMEGGQHFYSQIEDGRLKHLAWMVELSEEKQLDPALGGLVLPSDGTLILRVHTFTSSAREQEATFLQMLRNNLGKKPGVQTIYLAAPTENTSLRQTAESIGFNFLFTHVTQLRLGRQRGWEVHHKSKKNPPPPEVHAPHSPPLDEELEFGHG